MGIPTLTGSGISFNFIGAAIGKISLVSKVIALTISLNEAAGPNSVPPMLSIINFETDLT